MLNWIITSSLLILIVIALRFVLKGKISLRLQYGLWLLVLIRLLYPFSFGETAMSIGNWLDSAADTVEGQQMEEFVQAPLPNMSYEEAFDSVADKYYEQGIDINQIPEADLSETIEDEVLDTMRGGYTPEEILQMIWIAGMVVLGLWFVATNLQFSRKLKNSRVYLGTAGELLKMASLESTLTQKGNLIQVYQTDVVETPCLYGLMTPSIYLTEEVMDKKTCLNHVLEHESTHYHHLDYIWSVLRVVCLMLHWYNPLVWCAAFLSRNDAELACDEASIERLGETERAAYGRTLIGLTCEKRPAVLITATTMTGSGKSIKERIALIAKKPKMAVITIVIVVLLAILAVGWTYTGAKQEYASFSEWAETLDGKEFELFEIHKGRGPVELYYTPTVEEFGDLCEFLKTIPEEKCYRRKQTVDRYEDYSMFFLSKENEAVFQCLEDKTILFYGNSEMPKFAPDGKCLIIDSPELWHYIVDTVNEKGIAPDADTNEEANDAPIADTETEYVEYVLYETTADLNHDGIEDLVQTILWMEKSRYDKLKDFTILSKVQNCDATVRVYLGKSTQGEYEKSAVYVTEPLNFNNYPRSGAYVLTEREGKDYLLHSNMGEEDVWAMYTYEVMCLDEENKLRIVTNNDTQFVKNIFSEDWNVGAHREDVIPAFKEELMPWVENGELLIVHDSYVASLFSYDDVVIPANAYYNKVWEQRNESEWKKELEASVGPETWKQYLYANGDREQKQISFIENTIGQNIGSYFEEYNGSKLQRVEKCRSDAICPHGISTNCDVIYYKAEPFENIQSVLYKMIEAMILPRMERTDERPYTITEYAIKESPVIKISNQMWLVQWINGYYRYDGYELITFEEYMKSEGGFAIDGLLPFMRQGGSTVFNYLLIEENGVYRLEVKTQMLRDCLE